MSNEECCLKFLIELYLIYLKHIHIHSEALVVLNTVVGFYEHHFKVFLLFLSFEHSQTTDDFRSLKTLRVQWNMSRTVLNEYPVFKFSQMLAACKSKKLWAPLTYHDSNGGRRRHEVAWRRESAREQKHATAGVVGSTWR